MSKRNKQASRSGETSYRRAGRWLVGVILMSVVLSAGFWLWHKHAEPPAPDPSKLAGHWLRTDGGYMLELGDAAPDGPLMAAYFNPRPINVSRAKWHHQNGDLCVFVELRDVGYPGSTYTLTYQQEKDQLVGTYRQAAINQNFDVTFSRKK
jgi:hypothetical protein